MMEHFEYIDDFFKSTPTEEQKKEFDQKIISDPSFAEDVAFYLSAAQTARDLLAEEKKENFRKLYDQSAVPDTVSIKRSPRRMWSYLAAAAVLAGIVLGKVFFFSPNVAELASKYEKENFRNLGTEMSAIKDSIQMGRDLYNRGNSKEALQLFENILGRDSSSFEARKYSGIISLEMGQYDKALKYFQEMAATKGYYSNPGVFLMALTHMKRNGPGDKVEAIKLLRDVEQNNLDNSQIAREWLHQLD